MITWSVCECNHFRYTLCQFRYRTKFLAVYWRPFFRLISLFNIKGWLRLLSLRGLTYLYYRGLTPSPVSTRADLSLFNIKGWLRLLSLRGLTYLYYRGLTPSPVSTSADSVSSLYEGRLRLLSLRVLPPSPVSTSADNIAMAEGQVFLLAFLGDSVLYINTIRPHKLSFSFASC